MPDSTSTWPLVVSLLSLCCVIAGLAAGLFILRRRTEREHQMERRIAALSTKLSELDRRLSTRVATPEWSKVTASASRFDESGGSAPRSTLISVPDLSIENGAGHSLAGDELSQKHKEVWTLVESGHAAEEIARQTGQPIGEVELIIGLHRRLHPSKGAAPHVRSQ